MTEDQLRAKMPPLGTAYPPGHHVRILHWYEHNDGHHALVARTDERLLRREALMGKE